MCPRRTEDELLRSVALQNAASIVEARNRFERELLETQSELLRREQELRENIALLERLNRTGAMLSAELDLDTLMQAITDAATELSGARFGAFFYNSVDPTGEALVLYTLSGADRAAFENFGHPRPTALFGPTFRGEPPIRCEDVLADPRYGQWEPHRGMPAGHLPVRSYLAVPVIARSGEVLGGLFFGHPEPGVFTEKSEHAVVGVASQAAIAIDNARLYEAVRRAADERERLLAAEQQARREAERANLLKDEFLATLSHELRTPLHAILGWTQILAMPSVAPDVLARGVETIGRNARSQSRLIDDLLDMSRIVSGKIRLDVQAVDLVAIVEQTSESVRPAAEAKGVQLAYRLDSKRAAVRGDPHRLQQVVWNLLSNAVKFTPRHGRIQVVLRASGSQVELSVTDTGIGIEPAFLPHVFDRFRQADASSTRSHGGLGLGLSIVRSLIELHGGSVRAHSEGRDTGATFSFTLPLSPLRPSDDGARADAEPMPFPGQQFDLAGVRVLVVDDDPDGTALVCEILARHGASAKGAASASDALQQFASDPPDVLVSDIGMPGTNGYELLRAVRSLAPEAGGRVPAIALTALARSEDRTRTLLAGFQAHMAKPVQAHELLATVCSLAGRLA